LVFFLLFLFLLLRTEFRGSFPASASASANDIRLPYPVALFFQFDPLVAISTLSPAARSTPACCGAWRF
jgi:hypothetical protein